MTSVMAGVAMVRGATFTMNTNVRGSQITVGQLLTHSSGLACDDDNDDSPGNEDVMQSAHSKEDWYDFFMALPRVNAPGTTYAYCSAGINMVGSVIRDAAHQWLPAFFDERIARPLQMSRYAINLMPNGAAYSAGGMQLLPRDLLKFGQLYLNGGTWNGSRARHGERGTEHQELGPHVRPSQGRDGDDASGQQKAAHSAPSRESR